MTVIPATWEAEAGESLEPGRWEAAVSYGHAPALQLEQQSETLSLKNKMKYTNRLTCFLFHKAEGPAPGF